ncbi:MAG TPA: hypothetical protein PK742_08845 [Chitinophagales bacterium]|nr:hypothetical protein [Chitinophagales bacterium]
MRPKIYKVLILVATALLVFGSEIANAQEPGYSFNFRQISESEFRATQRNNYNATTVATLDSIDLEKAFELIDDTYQQDELILAERELCKSPRCLTAFHGLYPNLGILAFFIQDLHYEKVIFLPASLDDSYSSFDRFYGTFGAMSKNGFWVGLKREGSDNYLQAEICKVSDTGTSSILQFKFSLTDINEAENEPIFWVNENSFYLAVIDSNNSEKKDQQFYEISFNIK